MSVSIVFGRVPADPRQADERALGEQGAADPARAPPAGAWRGRGRTPRLRSRSCAPARSRGRARRRASARRREVVALVVVVEGRRADERLVVDRDAAERIDQGGEVGEVDLDDVVYLEAVAEEALDRLDRQPGPSERVGGVDLLGAVAGDLGERVAGDRQLANAARRRRAGGAGSRPGRGPTGSRRSSRPFADRNRGRGGAPRQHVPPSGERLLGVGGHAPLQLGARRRRGRRQKGPGERSPGQPILSTRRGVIPVGSPGSRAARRPPGERSRSESSPPGTAWRPRRPRRER